jgi:hypothetical protein
VPLSTFDSMYLYGNEKFISMTLKVTSMSVITFTFGTCELFKSWESYENGLIFLNAVEYSYYYYDPQWYNIDAVPERWYIPFCGDSYRVIFEGEPRTMLSNFRPGATSSPTNVAGSFDRMNDFLFFNTFHTS